jgi:predicted cobalt transporter CbtA
MKRKYNIEGMTLYSHFREEIGNPANPADWEAKLTGRQRIWIAVIALLFVGFCLLASHYDYWWMANIG